MRQYIEWNQDWSYVKQAVDAMEAAWIAGKGEGEAVTLPHTWNAVDGQDGGNDYYRGTCWYVKEWSAPTLPEGERLFVEFQGAAMSAEVFLNGHRMGTHEGGYSTFRVDLTEKLQERNVLAVAVDNSANEHIYPQVADFTFYGGLYRPVALLIVPGIHFALEENGESGIRVTPEVLCDAERIPTGEVYVTVELQVRGEETQQRPTQQTAQGTVNIISQISSQEKAEQKLAQEKTIQKATAQEDTAHGVMAQVILYDQENNPMLQETVLLTDGKGQIRFPLENARLWDGVRDPYLYRAKAVLDNGDSVETAFGCRSYYADPQKGFYLNGHPYPLRGVSRHQDRAGVGNALTMAMHQEDMEIIRELGANTLRLAHYQHAREFYDLCDAYGILVWAEIPYITLHMDKGQENTMSQMRELITQNYNHPSILCWGLSNEITASGGVTETLLENHRALNLLCHDLDTTRPTTMANVFMLETDSPILEIPDWNSYNLYFGWYLGSLEQNGQFFDAFHAKYPDRIIGFSEYGADANPQFQNAAPVQGDYSETYQTFYHEHLLAMIEERPWLWATHVWNLFDFGADGRDEGGKNGQNQKGLVTMDRKLKKDAFYLYKAHWNHTDPFVHLCGSRYKDRPEETTEIKVYSNLPSVTLYVDGEEVETRQGVGSFLFAVPISGQHVIEARGESCSDRMEIRRVSEPNPQYLFGKKGSVTNWFDRDIIKPGYFSIMDTMGELQSHPEAGAMVGRLMAGATAARGDVAEKVKDNPNLQKMMAGMTLDTLLRHAGDAVTEEQIKQLNAALQQIKKA